MDIIHECLSLVPVPYLAPSFAAFRFIWSSIEQAQASKQQLKVLAQSIGQLLQTIDQEYRGRRLLESRSLTPLANLQGLLVEISSFVQKEATRGFLKLLFTKDERIARIEEYHRHIGTLISALLNIQAWQSMNEKARATDQRELNERLSSLEINHQLLPETLNVHQRNMMGMMISLQRHIQRGVDEDWERRFFAHTLQYLTTSSGRQVEVEDWMITSYEVEFGHEIGSGGFGQVFKGSWNRTDVALKVLTMQDGVTPSSTSIRDEIQIWSKLRHPHILREFAQRPAI
ncbi:hypothetical protein PILCRDRAFT_15623 [Piloderma croceum F 1598]|uniref:Protein kinase domain-containing protein n=1 Tax=Piloderma croceum (strain F 1598) TaxID=765440 RepID=A0A0C3AGT5_PILCF|nr:hypothetical protein PILCRDRAFT_15623 [Piloderma croceum F 1598]